MTMSRADHLTPLYYSNVMEFVSEMQTLVRTRKTTAAAPLATDSIQLYLIRLSQQLLLLMLCNPAAELAWPKCPLSPFPWKPIFLPPHLNQICPITRSERDNSFVACSQRARSNRTGTREGPGPQTT